MDLLYAELSVSLLFLGSPRPKRPPCSGSPSVQEHRRSDSHVSECPTEADPEELQKSSMSHRMSTSMQKVL